VALALCVAALAGCTDKDDLVNGGASRERTSSGAARTHPPPRRPAIRPETKPDGPERHEPPARTASSPWDVPSGTKARSWRSIVIHHSATDEGSAAAFNRYHRSKGWKDLAYHFVIGNGQGAPDGVVETSARWRQQRAGAHAGNRFYNEYGIGICLVGNFESSRPTPKQMASLRKLLAYLTKRFKIAPKRVMRHSDIVPTKCPGRRLPWPVVE
jgi:N-acetyl-anhydromuramyl-L-alanine amidase AmpD